MTEHNLVFVDKDGKEHSFENARIVCINPPMVYMKRQKPKGLWKPELGDVYWFIEGDVGVYTHVRGHEDGDCVYAGRLAVGNVFETEALARESVKRNTITQKIRAIAASDGWVADWNTRTKWKFFIYYLYIEDKWAIVSTGTARNQGTIYMSKASAQRCLDELGDELNCLLEG